MVTHPQFKMCLHTQDQSKHCVAATIQATHTDLSASTIQDAGESQCIHTLRCA